MTTTEQQSLDDLIGLARGEVRPLAEDRREAVLAAVLAQPAAPSVGPARLPAVAVAVRWRRAALVGGAVVAVACAAAALAYWSPGPTERRGDDRVAPSPPPAPQDGDRAVGGPATRRHDAVLHDDETPPRDDVRDDLAEPRPGGTAPAPTPTPRTPSVSGAPRPEQIAPPSTFEANRRTGDKNIFPDDATKVAIATSGTTRVVVPVKVCVGTDGTVSLVQVLKTSGYPAYDALLERSIRAWTYEPFTVDGAVVPVCSVVQFVYSQQS